MGILQQNAWIPTSDYLVFTCVDTTKDIWVRNGYAKSSCEFDAHQYVNDGGEVVLTIV